MLSARSPIVKGFISWQFSMHILELLLIIKESRGFNNEHLCSSITNTHSSKNSINYYALNYEDTKSACNLQNFPNMFVLQNRCALPPCLRSRAMASQPCCNVHPYSTKSLIPLTACSSQRLNRLHSRFTCASPCCMPGVDGQ